MRVRGLFLLGTATATSALALAFACGFPSPALLDLDAATTNPESSTTDGPITMPDGEVPPEPDGGPDAADSGPKDCDAECDCDHDGVRGIQCDGGDCDDFDPNRKPGAAPSDRLPVGHQGDWNCDGVAEKGEDAGRRNRGSLKCEGLVPCNGGVFLGDPACGTAGDYVRCTLYPGNVCDVTGAQDQRVMVCR